MPEDIAVLVIPIAVLTLFAAPLLVRAAQSGQRRMKRQAAYAQYKQENLQKPGRKKKRFHEAPTSAEPRDRVLYYGTVLLLGVVLLGLGYALVTNAAPSAAIWGWPALGGGAMMTFTALFRRSREVPKDWHVMLTLAGSIGSTFCGLAGVITVIALVIAAISNPTLWPLVIAVAVATAIMGGFLLLFVRLEKVK